ncbi:MAG TPA: NADH-quinone oxidoreductase subunit N [Lacibacter sp.]|nr:NADH-quinone oxidoreductase subunit N [Lacibacter sp.]HMO87841.1 NADH-quinone oxidoreductase subunit N [Lacibacter sp.]HMP87451.1 NADH-quinone oxidoreductase subunit N [Lacibacter sp.]
MTEFLLLMKQELVVTLLIFLLLFIKLSRKEWNTVRLLNTVHLLLALNLLSGFVGTESGSLFGDMFRTHPLLVLEKNILSLGTLLISLQSHQWLRHHKHVPEFFLLLLSTLLGMFFLLSSNHLLLFYLALELSTIPLAALVNFDLEKRQSSEAAFKMIVSSAFSSGLLLLGISLLYGTTGTMSLSALSGLLTGVPLQLFAFILVLAGFGFKISAVPFHLWTADVYQGAPVAVTSYLSVVSKGAVVFVMVTVLYRAFGQLAAGWYNMLVVLSVATLLIGNLFALRQQNMKRFLAFSSIAQVGFILIGMTGYSTEGSTSVVYFVLVYLFSNLAVFGVVNLISAATGRETVDDYKGLYRTNPLLSWVLALGLFSLAGIPPTAGFFGKFFLLLAGAGVGNYLLIGFAALNMVVALYYYLRIIRAVFMDSNEQPIERVPVAPGARLALAICVGGLLVTGLASGAYHYIYSLIVLHG